MIRANQARRNETEQRHIADAEKKKAEQAEAETLADYRASTDDAIEQLIGSKPDLTPQQKTYLENTLKRWRAFAECYRMPPTNTPPRNDGSKAV
jgi:hypothetical protein